MELPVEVNLALEIPATLDVVHLALFGLLLVALLALLLRKSNPAIETPLEESQSKNAVPAPKPMQLQDINADGALTLLGILQSEGRLVDFIQEDMSAYADADIGAAARVVHKGLRQSFHEHFAVEPVIASEEGESISIEAGYKPSEIQLLGQVGGEGPFKGTLVHQGWKVTEVKLPKVVEGRDCLVVAPAQVEL